MFLTRMLGVYTVPRVLSLFLRSIMVKDTTALTQVRVQNIYRTSYRNKNSTRVEIASTELKWGGTGGSSR